jgi:hypothetical protein
MTVELNLGHLFFEMEYDPWMMNALHSECYGVKFSILVVLMASNILYMIS